jgi:hypothetical protein
MSQLEWSRAKAAMSGVIQKSGSRISLATSGQGVGVEIAP